MEFACSAHAGCPVADVICRTTELGLTITGAEIGAGDVTIIEARPVEMVGFRPACGAQGVLRDHVVRNVTDIPIAGHASRLRVHLPRFRCTGAECPRQIFQQQLDAAEPGAKTTKRCTKWILQRLVIEKMSVQAVATALGLGWDLVNDLALSAARSVVYDDPAHLADVRILGNGSTWKARARTPSPPSWSI